MELNEVIRRVVIGRWPLILACLVLAVGTTVAVSLAKHPVYASTARMQASSDAPGSDTEADSILNRVQGIATSSHEVGNALQAAGIHGIPASHFIPNGITVSRLGSSAVFDISVGDSDPSVARGLTEALTKDVVTFLNTSGNQQVNSLMSQMQSQRDKLAAQRASTALQLATAHTAIDNANVSAEVSTLDQEISNLDSAMRELAVGTVTSTSAALISDAGAAVIVRGHLATDLALAAVLGLVGGVLGSMLIEMVRPRLAGGRALAREMGVPLLGEVADAGARRHGHADATGSPNPLGPTALLALRTAASRHQIDTVVLVGSGDEGRITGLAARLEQQLAPSASRSQAPGPADPSSNGNGHRPGVGELHLAAEDPAGPPGQVALKDRITTSAPPRRLTVVTLSDDLTDGSVRRGLLLVVQPLVPYREAQRLGDLAAVTGWTVLGVLDQPSRRTKGDRHDQ